jgi:S-adenosylmethionine decarboxylase
VVAVPSVVGSAEVADLAAAVGINNMSKNSMMGLHVLADFRGVDAALLRDEKCLEETIVAAAKLSGATVLSSHFHRFGDGMGVTGVAVLAESHISIHTWPEFEFAALDVYMCGTLDPNIATQHVVNHLKPREHELRCIQRGAKTSSTDPC